MLGETFLMFNRVLKSSSAASRHFKEWKSMLDENISSYINYINNIKNLMAIITLEKWNISRSYRPAVFCLIFLWSNWIKMRSIW